MKVFSEELAKRRDERRSRRSATWSGLVVKIVIFILLLFLIRFIIGNEGKRFGSYWKEALRSKGTEAIND